MKCHIFSNNLDWEQTKFYNFSQLLQNNQPYLEGGRQEGEEGRGEGDTLGHLRQLGTEPAHLHSVAQQWLHGGPSARSDIDTSLK